MSRRIYLDHNATTPVRPEVVAGVAAALAEVGNPSSVHGFGRAARSRVETAREQVAALIGARADQIVFTSGGSEANNLALLGAGRGRILVSAIEHDSVLQAAPGADLIPVRRDGVVDLAALSDLLKRDRGPTLVSVMLANNETGVIQPVERVAELAHAAGAVLHCDAVQAAGKVRLDLAGLGVDLISLSAHKLGGPPGCGALVVGDAVALSPQVRGGGQERGRRAGTENTPAIVGFGIAAEMARLQIDTMQRLACLRDELEARVRGAVPRAHVIGHSSDRLPNTSCVALPGLASETQVIALDLAGVGVGAGSACSSGKVRPSHVLKAMGLTDEVAASAIRVSLGWQSTSADVSGFVTAWLAIVARHGARDSVPQTAA